MSKYMILPRYDISVITKKNKYKKILNMSKNSNNITEIDGRPMNIPKSSKKLDKRLNESKGDFVYLNIQNRNNTEVRNIDLTNKINLFFIFVLFIALCLLIFGIYSWLNSSDEDVDKQDNKPSKKQLESFNYILISSWLFYLFLGPFNEIEIVSIIQTLFFLFSVPFSFFVWWFWSLYNINNS